MSTLTAISAPTSPRISRNRQNSRQGTYVEGYANILFAGDSRTVSLEVDDDQTVPALLERGLRARGLRYNVINLGVSGHGTDQAVRKAIAFSERYRPTDIIYMFTDSDTYDNNVLKPIAGNPAKGVYVRDADRDPFAPYDFRPAGAARLCRSRPSIAIHPSSKTRIHRGRGLGVSR